MKYLFITLTLIILIGCSSNGTKIAFVSGSGLYSESTHIHVANSDGTNLTDLIDAREILGIWPPEWSPNGNKILYTVIEKDYTSSSLYIMNEDGTDAMKLDINEANAQSSGV